SNKNIADLLKNLPRAIVVCDSAEPKSIDELKGYGIMAIPAVKGQGSVYQGIQYVQQQRISLTRNSTNFLKAYQNYLFMEDKEGKIINEPDDTIHTWSNSMDAVRYGITSLAPNQINRSDRKRVRREREDIYSLKMTGY
ncbi:MAG: terminase large subunit, partial [Patescibacteria group bacterium]